MRIEAQVNRGFTSIDQPTTHLVRLRFTAPIAEQTVARTPVNVSLVMDRSGSMSGEKLETARAAMDASVRMLRDADRFSVVTFDGRVDVVHRSSLATEKARLRGQNRINRMEAGGSTNLSGGWLEGASQVRSHVGSGHLARVLLATDGQATDGIVREEQLFEEARMLRMQGISTSTIGIGQGFNESLLQGMAEHGGGNFYFVEHVNQLTELLTSELGEALQITVRQPRVELTLPTGAEVTLLNRFELDRSDGACTVLPDDLTSGQAVELAFLVSLPPGVPAALATLGFVIRGGVGRVALASTALRWTYVSTAMFDSAPRDFMVEATVARYLMARARREALEHNEGKRFREARESLEQAANMLRRLAPLNREVEALLSGLDDEGRDYATEMTRPRRMELRMAAYATLHHRDVDGKVRRDWDA